MVDNVSWKLVKVAVILHVLCYMFEFESSFVYFSISKSCFCTFMKAAVLLRL